MVRGLNGLGLNPAITAATGYKPGSAPPVSTGRTGPVGWTRWGLDQVKSTQLHQPWERRILGIQAALLAKYGAQIPTAETLYGKAWGKSYCEMAATSGYVDMLNPIGVISVLGVPFTPDKFKDNPQAVLEQTFTPTAEQKFIIDWQIYAAGQQALARRFNRELKGGTAMYQDLVVPTQGIQRILATTGKAYSVNWATHDGQLVTTFPGFLFPSIEPTEAERTQAGGLAAFYARGGFLLDRNHLEGKSKINTTTLQWGEGYFLCPNGRVAMATKKNRGDNGYGWQVYVKVSPTTYAMRVSARDAPWYVELRDGIGNLMASVPGVLCASKDVIQAANADLVAEICLDKAGKPVAKGTPGATCTSPTTSAQVAVGAGNAYLNFWCGRVTATPPLRPQPFAPQRDDLDPPPSSAAPWGWLVAGGLVVGAFALTRK